MSASPTTTRESVRSAHDPQPDPRRGHAPRTARPDLRVIEGGLIHRERRQRLLRAVGAVLAGALLVAALWLTYTIIGAAASARTVESGGTAVVTPGETLWDVAVTHAPAGTDPRSYLEDLRSLNATDGTIEPWTVVQLPAAP
jgi:hypothetical protein